MPSAVPQSTCTRSSTELLGREEKHPCRTPGMPSSSEPSHSSPPHCSSSAAPALLLRARIWLNGIKMNAFAAKLITNNAVQSSEIKDGAVASGEIKNGSVASCEITDRASRLPLTSRTGRSVPVTSPTDRSRQPSSRRERSRSSTRCGARRCEPGRRCPEPAFRRARVVSRWATAACGCARRGQPTSRPSATRVEFAAFELADFDDLSYETVQRRGLAALAVPRSASRASGTW